MKRFVIRTVDHRIPDSDESKMSPQRLKNPTAKMKQRIREIVNALP